MLKIIRINNLSTDASGLGYSDLSSAITELVAMNIRYSNDGAYNDESMSRLMSNKSIESTLEMIKSSFVICVFDDERLIACGFSKIQDGRYFSKSLHVHPDFRGRGLAAFICDEREDFLRSIGVKELYIESLKFENTIQFHKSRGFQIKPPYKELKNTILMKKAL